ncbi:hypothetical protein SNOG_14932 [Parastagonospora nodorum SN15]|uniref:Uncharacterized protein n=1 Tax=Phaeosphaeria nodorum (strain SN15 / ATCC MYA-4574 / FGSC 10173) TaxID=321614 RepID=Q0U080_PHANO|nr:hypothetical protein SNOG_14932 [Parastagonospora nodorum SN15]EAT77784.1 hypothetical protein SNOG_14932 [Parastagonospora nodorum SN15]
MLVDDLDNVLVPFMLSQSQRSLIPGVAKGYNITRTSWHINWAPDAIHSILQQDVEYVLITKASNIPQCSFLLTAVDTPSSSIDVAAML